MTEPFPGTNGHGSSRKTGNGFRVICSKPVKGTRVKVVTDREPLDTDVYKSGLAICDINVYNTNREPVFLNNREDTLVLYAE